MEGVTIDLSSTNVTQDDLVKEYGEERVKEVNELPPGEFEKEMTRLKEEVAANKLDMAVPAKNLMKGNELLIEGMVETVNGEAVNVSQWAFDLHKDDYEFLTREVNRLANAVDKKK